MEYKFVELLSVNFGRSSEDTVRQSITYRYNAMKSRLAIMQTRLQVQGCALQGIGLRAAAARPRPVAVSLLMVCCRFVVACQEVSHLVKLKNPSLLLQMQKPAGSAAGAGAGGGRGGGSSARSTSRF
jgi:hypothetical protein